MDKPTFLAIVTALVEGFEDPAFRQSMAQAKAAGDVGQLVSLSMALQTRVFAKYGLDPELGTATFKQAGREYGTEPEVAPFLAQMKAALL